ncbi:MAG: sigma-70 family RNA polymerase sigma factor [Longimicrobiaceae bacterium]
MAAPHQLLDGYAEGISQPTSGLTALGLYLRELRSVTALEEGEDVRLGRSIRLGSEEALRELVTRTRGYVVAYARAYANRGVDYEDLIQEGNLALIVAARKYDPDRGASFIHHATWWIRSRLQRAVRAQGPTVRRSETAARMAIHVRRSRRQLEQLLHRHPTVEEIAFATGLDPAVVQLAEAESGNDSSLNATLGGSASDRVTSLQDLLTAEDEHSDPHGRLLESLRREDAARALEALPPQHARVLRLMHGVGVDREHSGQEIGELLGVSREAVRTMADRALARARAALAAPRSSRRRPPAQSASSARPAGESPTQGHHGQEPISDAAWARVAAIIPERLRPQGRGGPPRPRREVLDGILWVLRNDAAWSDLPRCYPSHRTCRDQLEEWVANGTFGRLLDVFAETFCGGTRRCFADLVASPPADLSACDRNMLQLLASPATVRLLERMGSALLAGYPPSILSRAHATRGRRVRTHALTAT